MDELYEVIDMENSIRKSQFEFFNSFFDATFGFNVRIDVTSVKEYSSKTKTSFFTNFLYIITICLNQIKEMRLRNIDNEIRLYKVINPNFTVKTDDGSFNNVGHKYTTNYDEFYKLNRKAILEGKKVKNNKDEYNANKLYNDFYMSCLLDFDFEGMTHPSPGGNKTSQSVPRIFWGSYVNENDKYFLTLNITVSHALCDGEPLKQAFNLIKKACNNFEEFILANSK